jgi:lipoprotein-anchoring transpeptidase ErfK/SrfK
MAENERSASNWSSWALGAVLFVVLLLVYGVVSRLVTGEPSTAPQSGATDTPACAAPSLIAAVTSEKVAARKAPSPNADVIKTFGKKSVLGVPQVFLIRKPAEGPGGEPWLKVLLPVRPNGTTGFIPASDVTVKQTVYRLRVVRKKFSVYFYEGCKLIDRFKVGIGNGATPTPVGKFYLQALYKLPNPNTIYGTYAYALSGYSEAIKRWQRGVCAGVEPGDPEAGKCGGIIGLHGTNDPQRSIGRYVSNGCVRMRNKDIESLVPKLPLGTPIEIQ